MNFFFFLTRLLCAALSVESEKQNHPSYVTSGSRIGGEFFLTSSSLLNGDNKKDLGSSPIPKVEGKWDTYCRYEPKLILSRHSSLWQPWWSHGQQIVTEAERALYFIFAYYGKINRKRATQATALHERTSGQLERFPEQRDNQVSANGKVMRSKVKTAFLGQKI